MNAETLYSILIGLLQILASLPLALLADKIPPNPLMGFRVAYTMTTKRAWIRLNKLMGAVLASIGGIAIPIGILAGIGVEATFLAVADTLIVLALTEYSRIYAERELVREPGPLGQVEPVRGVGKTLEAIIASIALGTIPPAVIAAMDMWSEGLYAAAIIFLSLPVLPLYLAYLSLRRPEAYSYPWLSSREHRIIVVLSPVSVSLIVAGIEIIPAYFPSGMALLSIGAALVIVELWVVLRAYARSGGNSPRGSN